MMFAVVSLLVAAAIVGMLATRQLGAVRAGGSDAAAVAKALGASAPVSVVEVPRQVQRQVQSDLAKGMAQAARGDETDR